MAGRSVSLAEILQGLSLPLPTFLQELRDEGMGLKEFTTTLEERGLSQQEFDTVQGSVAELVFLVRSERQTSTELPLSSTTSPPSTSTTESSTTSVPTTTAGPTTTTTTTEPTPTLPPKIFGFRGSVAPTLDDHPASPPTTPLYQTTTPTSPPTKTWRPLGHEGGWDAHEENQNYRSGIVRNRFATTERTTYPRYVWKPPSPPTSLFGGDSMEEPFLNR